MRSALGWRGVRVEFAVQLHKQALLHWMAHNTSTNRRIQAAMSLRCAQTLGAAALRGYVWLASAPSPVSIPHHPPESQTFTSSWMLQNSFARTRQDLVVTP
mmetsp:Transcript_52935/g.86997  ORF Transcript_52935/g.86997 Transcript_52935/m.86997 type:complete len:101 (+) Transcript_52935:279-581(+)